MIAKDIDPDLVQMIDNEMTSPSIFESEETQTQNATELRKFTGDSQFKVYECASLEEGRDTRIIDSVKHIEIDSNIGSNGPLRIDLDHDPFLEGNS